MGAREDKMVELGHEYITGSPKPVPDHLGWLEKVKIVNNVAYVAGHPWGKGSVPSEHSEEEATKSFEDAIGNLLFTLKGKIGTLDRVEEVIHMNCYTHCSADYAGVSKVACGASEFLMKVFGDAGKHSRTALGVAQLPAGTAVEVDLIVKLKPE
jgi:enamine deaminase RidA (YjgF/YER057c/UK114 family)